MPRYNDGVTPRRYGGRGGGGARSAAAGVSKGSSAAGASVRLRTGENARLYWRGSSEPWVLVTTDSGRRSIWAHPMMTVWELLLEIKGWEHA